MFHFFFHSQYNDVLTLSIDQMFMIIIINDDDEQYQKKDIHYHPKSITIGFIEKKELKDAIMKFFFSKYKFLINQSLIQY